jgi:hypothetical protein
VYQLFMEAAEEAVVQVRVAQAAMVAAALVLLVALIHLH